MRKINYISYMLAGSLLLGSCTKDFEKINTNPNTTTDLATNILFPNAIMQTSGGEYEAWRNNLIYNSQFIQQMASLSWEQGDKYRFNEGYNSALWDSYYPGAVKTLVNLIEKTKGVATDVNYNSAARILKVFVFLRLTDSYGDIPYSEAGLGYISSKFSPKYDEQKTILADMINELDAAAKAFDSNKPFQSDLTSYNGNVTLWKKAAYSLMLRVSMRMSKRDAAAAQAGVQKAVAGGVFSDYTESFRIKHNTSNYVNPNSTVLGYFNGSRLELSSNSFKLSKTFVDLLKNSGDVRLPILSVVRTGPVTSPTVGTEDNTIANQKGLPNGTNPLAFVGIEGYSQLRSDFAKADVSNILVSHAQTQLLLAEARERGWISSSTSEAYFRDGVKSAVNQLKLYNAAAGLFDDAAINTFAGALNFPATQAGRLDAINTQYYIASFLDGYEPHANWRRSGSPVLTPVNFAGNYTGGVIPRRFQYPASEAGLNGDNLKAAVTRQGADTWTTKVWWDQ